MPDSISFAELGLPNQLLSSIKELGYETPSPVQAESIPILLQGEDLLAQAQTGTGKTAAFALPILATIQLNKQQPQALVIAPTRELAIQVAEAFQRYAKSLKGFHVTPIYGGQDYSTQLRALKRGSHVIVGTPGRVMDHLRRGSLTTDSLTTVVLDEADEMLNMGFIDDIEWILAQIPQQHQTALFSATMPSAIKKIAKRYLQEATLIHIAPKKTTVEAIEQSHTRVARHQKLELLTRFLEVEDVEAAIIFARTKVCSDELAEKLQARGYAAAALNGDMNQNLRKKTVDRIKNGSLDIVVATDVAARGIDVERISHVINYDIPYDTEAYIHRIGRTGRAGRKGKALLFVTPREHHLLKDIERAVGAKIKHLAPPSVKQMSEKRSEQLAVKVSGIIAKSKNLKAYQKMVTDIIEQTQADASDVAASVLYLLQQANPLSSGELASAEPEKARSKRSGRKPSARHSVKNKANRAFAKKRRATEPAYGKKKKTAAGKTKKSRPHRGKS